VWLQQLRKLNAELTFQENASAFQLDEAEIKLGTNFPDELRAVLGETNGVVGEYGLGLLWPVDRIVEDNLKFRQSPDFRSHYMPFDYLLFFGDAGNGDQFAFPIDADGVIHRRDIFAWTHEDDSRRWVAPSLSRYFEWWVEGKIKL
jgi:hypothetical protein